MTTQKKRWNVDRSVSVRNYMLIATFVLAASLVRADDVVVHWNRVMLSTIAAAGTNPLVSTRVTAIVQTAVFDSVGAKTHGFSRCAVPKTADPKSTNPATKMSVRLVA